MVIRDNTALAGNADGGGLFLENTSVDQETVIINTVFEGNMAREFGGAIATEQGEFTTHPVIVINSIIDGNAAGVSGGGIDSTAPVYLINTTLTGNIAERNGGGIALRGGGLAANATVTGNAAGEFGGAIFVGGFETVSGRDGLLLLGNSIVSGNVAEGAPLTGDIGLVGTMFDNGGVVFIGDNVISAGRSIELAVPLFDPPEIAADGPLDPASPYSASSRALSDIFASSSLATDVLANPITGTTTQEFSFGVPSREDGINAAVRLNVNSANPAGDAGNGALSFIVDGDVLGVDLVGRFPDPDSFEGLDEEEFGVDLNGDGDLDDVIGRLDELAFDARGQGFGRVSGGDVDLGAFETQRDAGVFSVSFESFPQVYNEEFYLAQTINQDARDRIASGEFVNGVAYFNDVGQFLTGTATVPISPVQARFIDPATGQERSTFDVAFYRANLSAAERARIDSGEFENALDHYIRVGAFQDTINGTGVRQFDPNEFFDSAAYLAANPDIAAAGLNPYFHFLQFGELEAIGAFDVIGDGQANRGAGISGVDLEVYAAQNPDVAGLVESGASSFFQHFLQFGRFEGRPGVLDEAASLRDEDEDTVDAVAVDPDMDVILL